MSAPAFLKAHYQTNPNEIALAARALTKLIKGPRAAHHKRKLSEEIKVRRFKLRVAGSNSENSSDIAFDR
jgi:hypothetical protein